MKDDLSTFNGPRDSLPVTDASSDNPSRPSWTAEVRLPAVGEVIEDGDVGAGSDKAVGKVTPYETGAAGDQSANPRP
jgi:hypothetical protein